ncbi:unnamed protein product [Mucor circinelloides]
MTLRQQKISSLRRKDTMWIYKNPQGLLILEDELNERRKRRSARHRLSPPLPHSQPDTNHKQQRQATLTPPAMNLTSPSDVLIPVVKKTDIDVKPSSNKFIEKPLKKPATTDKPAIKESKEQQPPAVKKNLIEERSKLFKSPSSSKMPRSVTATSNLKQETLQIKPSKSTLSHQDSQFLLDAKHKLASVKQKIDGNDNQTTENDSPVAPPRRKGLVSSFVSAFEAPSTELASPSRKPPTRAPIAKPRALVDVKPTASQSYNPVHSSRLASRDPLPPIKPRRQSVMPSPSTTVSSPALSTPSPFTAAAPTDSYFPATITSSPQDKQAASNEPEIKISPSVSSQVDSVPCSSEINVYLPQLSPEISFHETEDMLEDMSADEQGEEEEDSDDDEPLDKEVASILVRPEIKKRVSFSDQLLTYIPEQQASDDDTASNKSSENPFKNPVLDFSRALSFELSDVKSKLIAERKVNTTPSRDKYVPAAVTKKIFEPEITSKRPSVANVHAPQKLSNKLLDMFQQKLSKPSPIEQQQQQLPKTQPSESRGLVHLTKSRPRKPPSLKKPTYPAATAQPNWRERATNRKYEFIA